MNKIILGIIAFIVVLAAIGIAVSADVLGFTQITLNSGTPGNLNSGQYWILTWVDTLTPYEFVHAIILSDDFESETGVASQQTFDITIDDTDNSCDYTISVDPFREIVHTANVVWLDTPPWFCPAAFDAPAQQWVNDNCRGGYVCQNGIFNDRLWCFRTSQQLAQIGETSNERKTFETTISVQPEGKPVESVVLSNTDIGAGTQTNLGDNVAIEWQGFLTTGVACPISNGHTAAHSNNFPGGWRLIDFGNYILYENYVSPGGGFQTDLLSVANGQISTDQAESNWNTRAQVAITEDIIPNNILVTDSSSANGAIEILMDYPMVFPVFRMLVDADYLELVILLAQPDIISTTLLDFDEGQVNPEPLSVVVKNTGSGPGDINVRVTNCFGGISDGFPQTKSFQAGETKTFTFDMYCGSDTSDANFNGGCRVEATNTPIPGQAQLIDILDFAVSCQSLQECIPNHARCEGNIIVQCLADGSDEVEIETCDADEICDQSGGDPVCKKENGVACTIATQASDCNDNDVCTIDVCSAGSCSNELDTSKPECVPPIPWETILWALFAVVIVIGIIIIIAKRR